jgi:transcriptional regulator with XRE-family HTH domain
MNISKSIKEQRNKLSLSQEELAEKIYVTRQTIGNWENGKSYPDVHSLVLLSQIFDLTIDSLIKGDLEIMEQQINKSDIKKLNIYSWLMGIGLILSIVIIVPVSTFLAIRLNFIPFAGIIVFPVWIITLFFAYKAEKIKKQYDVHTYREIVAFTKGKTLDEITKLRESGKRKYQKILSVAVTTIFALIVMIVFLIIVNVPWGI